MLLGEESERTTEKEEWVLLDGKGEMELVEGGRNAIMKRTGLPTRDLRKFLSYHSVLLSRERAIVVNFDHVKAIITANEVFLLNSGDSSVTPLVHELQAWFLRHHHGWSSSNPHEIKVLPFEFVALEGCLEAAYRVLDNEAKTLEQQAHSALDKLTSNTLNLERIRQIKIRLVDFTEHVQKMRNKLKHLLVDNKDMTKMYLTEKVKQQISSGGNVTKQFDVQDFKMLLKDYFVHMDGTLKKLSTLLTKLSRYIDEKEAYIRNKLRYQLDIFPKLTFLLSTASAGLAVWNWLC